MPVYVGDERRVCAHKYQDPGLGISLEERDKELLLILLQMEIVNKSELFIECLPCLNNRGVGIYRNR